MTRISSLFWLDDCSASSDSCSDDVEEREDDYDENMNSSTSLSRCINMSNVMNNGIIAEKSSLSMHPSNQIERNMNQNLNVLPIIVNERERLGQSVTIFNQDMAFNDKINVDTDAGVKVDNHDVEEKVEIEKTIIQFGKRIKLVRIYEDPNIYTMDNFLNEKELDFFDNYIWEMEKNQAFRKSFIEKGTNNRSFDESRTSQFVHFEKCQNKRIADIEKRAAELVGMSIECVEPLQLVRYRAGQFFDDHHDLGVLYDDGSVELPKRSPRRICTLFLYMNDIPVENGGSTRFPLLQSEEKDYLDVQPKRGMAVLWCNIRKDGMPDERLGKGLILDKNLV